MEKIRVMVSSTVEDLKGERDAIQQLFNNNPIFELLGAKPYISTSVASSSAITTINMAKDCNLYILILGDKFGFELEDGRSATEVEFDTAFKQDPTKVLVFLKKTSDALEARQSEFIKKVSNYYSGYWRVEFQYTHELQNLVNESVLEWLKDRASLNKRVSYCEHFIREAIRLKPTDETKIYYKVQENILEIEYQAMGQSRSIHYNRIDVYKDFWKCLYELKNDIDRWTERW